MYLYEAIEKKDIRAGTADRVGDLSVRMRKMGYSALPIVENGIFLGMVLESQLQQILEPDGEDGTAYNTRLDLLDISYAQARMHPQQHIFDALPYFRDFEGNILPLVSENNHYAGHVSTSGLIEAMQRALDTGREGSILILEAGQKDHALSYLAHIVESTDSRILLAMTRDIPGSGHMEITLKLSVSDPSDVIAALSHHDYIVKSAFHSEIDRSAVLARYEHLMNYINM